MAKHDWKIAAVVLVSVLAGFCLAGRGLLSSAYGQIGGQASGIVCLLGEERSGSAPIVLVDAANATLLVYDYSYSNNRIEFVSARTYRYDRLTSEFNIDGPSVEDVRRSTSR